DVEYKQVFNLSSSELDTIYKSVTKSKKAEWRAVTVTRWKSFNGENQGSRNSTSKTININDAAPYIDDVSYKDVNSNIQDILKNEKKILRYNSESRVITGKAEATKHATL